MELEDSYERVGGWTEDPEGDGFSGGRRTKSTKLETWEFFETDPPTKHHI